MSGHFYVLSDGERLHLWADDGYDGWDDSIWAEGLRSDQETAGERASGVALPMDVVDEFVVMRLAEIIDERRFVAAIERAVARYGGNGGCLSLATKVPDLTAALQKLGLQPEDTQRSLNYLPIVPMLLSKLADTTRACRGHCSISEANGD